MITVRARDVGLSLMLGLVLALGVNLGTVSCAHPTPPTITTPQGQVAYQVEDAVDAIGVLQHAAIQWSRGDSLKRRPIALKVVRATRAMAQSLDAAVTAGTGTHAIYLDIDAALLALDRDPDLARFHQEITAARAIVLALGGK